MIPIGGWCDKRNELQQGLDRQRDVVTDEILNENKQRAQKEIDRHLRKSAKQKTFNRKNKRRNRRRK